MTSAASQKATKAKLHAFFDKLGIEATHMTISSIQSARVSIHNWKPDEPLSNVASIAKPNATKAETVAALDHRLPVPSTHRASRGKVAHSIIEMLIEPTFLEVRISITALAWVRRLKQSFTSSIFYAKWATDAPG
ncbi:hypothetical protein AC579_9355 [Pseudocercospora musae]|uniref:Uncharacterized protein n=1 Tax=Pseudocercospora musae TaxID=113226 RepID=A0A139I2J1_9PEZI|nr:hypothetical protein AC579_9355 [Pseudocercospora musae]